jgi:hypothetical protein
MLHSMKKIWLHVYNKTDNVNFFYWMFSVHLHTNVNNNLQRMHFSYIYYISQYSYMFRSIWTILRELYSKKIKC